MWVYSKRKRIMNFKTNGKKASRRNLNWQLFKSSLFSNLILPLSFSLLAEDFAFCFRKNKSRISFNFLLTDVLSFSLLPVTLKNFPTFYLRTSLCPLDLIPSHVFRNLILLILSCFISSTSASLYSFPFVLYIFK